MIVCVRLLWVWVFWFCYLLGDWCVWLFARWLGLCLGWDLLVVRIVLVDWFVIN